MDLIKYGLERYRNKGTPKVGGTEEYDIPCEGDTLHVVFRKSSEEATVYFMKRSPTIVELAYIRNTFFSPDKLVTMEIPPSSRTVILSRYTCKLKGIDN